MKEITDILKKADPAILHGPEIYSIRNISKHTAHSTHSAAGRAAWW